MDAKTEDMMLSALGTVAPGTPLREGLDYIISARTGALIVIGDMGVVDPLCNGGFRIDTPFSPQRLFELAKMDGAIVLDRESSGILKANVHLVPDASLPTSETGMRHRTAERVSKQTGAFVISVSQRREVVSLYLGGNRLILEDIEVVLAKADQALQTLQRYRARLDEVAGHLTVLEFEDVVTVGDVATVIQRSEMVQRVAREVGRYIIELGTEGRLVRMQSEELLASVEDDYVMLIRDYAHSGGSRKVASIRAKIAAMSPEQLLDDAAVASALGYPVSSDIAESHVQASGYRLLHRIPMLPGTVINRVVERFVNLPALLQATEKDLDAVDGVGLRRARAIIDGLRRMREHATV
ncbi:MAG: DNA integrity scanning diadenylate cyclase DisA [Coriobacteriia bacterium]|nr:DNA integrity scanning diadenylate cyclase DisA [Coriobacteriia bacterium]